MPKPKFTDKQLALGRRAYTAWHLSFGPAPSKGGKPPAFDEIPEEERRGWVRMACSMMAYASNLILREAVGPMP
jgi:hypothetical protein